MTPYPEKTPNETLDPYLKSLASVGRWLGIIKAFSWTGWAVLFVWTSYKHIEVGGLILACLAGTWFVVKLSYEFDELTKRKNEIEWELYRKKGEESLRNEVEALEELEKTDFARQLDEQWQKLRSGRGIQYSGDAVAPYTDTLGRPLSGSVLQMLAVERQKLTVQLALEHPEEYRTFHEHLSVGNPYWASTLPTPTALEKHKNLKTASEFLKVWKSEPGQTLQTPH